MIQKKKKKAENNILVRNSSNVQAVTQISETTPVQMITERQLELNQQLSLDINNYEEGGWVIHKHKMSFFLEHDLLVCFMSFPPIPESIYTLCGHAISNEMCLKESFFFVLVRHLMPAMFGDSKGLQQRVPSDQSSIQMHAQ